MGKIHKDQQGFSAVETVLVLIVVGLIGFVGWYVWHNNQKNENEQLTDKVATTKQESKKPNIPNDWTWFISKDKSIEFAYPKTWGTLREGSPEDGYKADDVFSSVVLTKKQDFLVNLKKGFFNSGWHSWDTNNNTLVVREDLSPPESYTAPYSKPNKLGSATPVKPLIVASADSHAIYEEIGNGAFNCGTHYYFFDVKDTVVWLTAGLCDDGDPERPIVAGQTNIKVVEEPLKSIYKYIQE